MSEPPSVQPSSSTPGVAAATHRLAEATRTRTPCRPVRDLLADGGVDAAYAVQRAGLAPRIGAGDRPVGRKIGLTNPAVQAQLGVDQPDVGTLLASMRRSPDAPIDVTDLLQPRVEAEVAFVLSADLDGPVDLAAVRAAVRYAVPALEIVDSRIDGWDIGIVDTVADNASSGQFVLGKAQLPLSDVEPADVVMSMTRAGASGSEVVSTGSGRDCLGDPLAALAWLAGECQRQGDPLRAGEVVLSGALGPMVAVRAGDVFTADITGLGTVSASFTAGAA